MQNIDPSAAQAAPVSPATDLSPPKLTVRCPTCHGESVLRDAWACWSLERQEWEIDQVFDHAFCETCESECTVETVPHADSR